MTTIKTRIEYQNIDQFDTTLTDTDWKQTSGVWDGDTLLGVLWQHPDTEDELYVVVMPDENVIETTGRVIS